MKPTEAQVNKLFKFVNDLYQNKIIGKNARLTEKGILLQRKFTGVVYHNLLPSSASFKSYVDTGDDSDLKDTLKRGHIWLLINTHGNWSWISNLNESFDLDEIINLNYEMYKIPRYSELEHAAELLADNEFDDI